MSTWEETALKGHVKQLSLQSFLLSGSHIVHQGKPTYAVCELAALASCSPRGRGIHSRWCCSPPRGRGWPCCPASRRRPAALRWPAGDGVPAGTETGVKITDAPTTSDNPHKYSFVRPTVCTTLKQTTGKFTDMQPIRLNENRLSEQVSCDFTLRLVSHTLTLRGKFLDNSQLGWTQRGGWNWNNPVPTLA